MKIACLLLVVLMGGCGHPANPQNANNPNPNDRLKPGYCRCEDGTSVCRNDEGGIEHWPGTCGVSNGTAKIADTVKFSIRDMPYGVLHCSGSSTHFDCDYTCTQEETGGPNCLVRK